MQKIAERAAPRYMTFEEYDGWALDKHTEWINGEVIELMSAKDPHQALQGFLEVLLTLYVSFLHLGKIRTAGTEMKLTTSARQPDILFVANENLNRLSERRLEGAADLAVEIISTESVTRDRVTKFNEYAAGGVREYWIIDPRPGKERADFFHLDESGHFAPFATEADDRVESTVLHGFWLNPTWLWDGREPFEAFSEMIGLPAEIVETIRQQAQANLNAKE